MKKRLLMLGLCILMAVSSVACSSEEAKEDKSRKENTEKEDSNDKKDKKDKKDRKDNKEDKNEVEDLIDFEVEAEGYCGVDLIWQYGNGVLKISGSGEMTEFCTDMACSLSDNPCVEFPWSEYADDIQRVYIDGASNISSKAFENFNHLSYVKMDDTITNIGESAFQKCANLKEISFSEELTEIGTFAFYKCESIESLEFPRNLTQISNEAFEGCTSLESVGFPDELETIANSAFRNCSNLKDVELPSGLLNVGSGIFGGCANIDTIDFSNTNMEIMYREAFYQFDKTVILPKNLKQIRSQGGVTGEAEASLAGKAGCFYILDTMEYYDLIDDCTVVISYNGNEYSDNDSLVRALNDDGITIVEGDPLVFNKEVWADSYTPDMGNIIEEKQY